MGVRLDSCTLLVIRRDDVRSDLNFIHSFILQCRLQKALNHFLSKFPTQRHLVLPLPISLALNLLAPELLF